MSHSHSIYDTDKHFVIDPSTRSITALSDKLTLIQYDHNCERYTFEIPRIIEGHDMSECNRVEIHYINVNKKNREQTAGVYTVNDVKISTIDKDAVVFTWLISRNATKFVGPLNFLIRFACVSDNGEIDYEWYTAICKIVSILDGMNNGEAVSEDYADILEEWRNQIILRLEENTSCLSELKETLKDVDKNIEGYKYKELIFDLKLSDVFDEENGPTPYVTDTDLSFTLLENKDDTGVVVDICCNESDNYWYLSTETQPNLISFMEGGIKATIFYMHDPLDSSIGVSGSFVPYFNALTEESTDIGGSFIIYGVDNYPYTNAENVSIKIYKINRSIYGYISKIIDEINGEVI